MSNYSTLIEKIDERLKQYNYFSDNEHVIPNALFISYVKNPGLLKVRNLCAVIDIPHNLVEKDPIQRYFNFIKSNLLVEYGEAVLWKELEFCLVGLCNNEAYKVIQGEGSRIVETVSFSLNSLLGCSLINKETFEHYDWSSWGLFFAGDHFKIISSAVEEWCQNEKKDKMISWGL